MEPGHYLLLGVIFGMLAAVALSHRFSNPRATSTTAKR
jgi:hypothetical protein